MNTRWHVLLSFALLTLFGQPRPGWCDGAAVLYMGTAETIPTAAQQKAVLWQRENGWDLTIWPQFTREPGEWAWIVPLPTKPSAIQKGSPLFFSQLELMTAPTFVPICSGGCCCDSVCDAGEGSVDTGNAQSMVTVWQSGTVGNLEYVVLSSTEGASLVEWLNQEGFTVAGLLAQTVQKMDTLGTYFFAARQAATAPQDAPIDPVTFVLEGLDQPVYPMELTQSVIGNTPLALTLWMVTPPEGTYRPANIPHMTANDLTNFYPVHYSVADDCMWVHTPYSQDQYTTILSDYFAANPTAAVLVSGSVLANQHPILSCNGELGACSGGDFSDGIEDPSFGLEWGPDWSPEIRELEEHELFVARWDIRWSADGPAEDLLFTPAPSAALRHGNVYCDDTKCSPCTCHEEDSYSDDDVKDYTDSWTTYHGSGDEAHYDLLILSGRDLKLGAQADLESSHAGGAETAGSVDVSSSSVGATSQGGSGGCSTGTRSSQPWVLLVLGWVLYRARSRQRNRKPG